MLDILAADFRRVHYIGIGGTGMSGLAEISIGMGFEVSGCDAADSEVIQRLREMGAKVHIGHDPAHVSSAEFVVYSNAIREANPELAAARSRRIPVISRAEMLAEITRMKACIAIGGTHGKTTTTSLVGEALSAGGLAPTVVVGGRLKRLGGGVISGGGDFIVTEADEYERSFLKLSPTIVVLTTIDSDHLECYGSFEALKRTFIDFANSVPFYGRIVVCIDDPEIAGSIGEFTRTVVTYGFSPEAAVRLSDPEFDGVWSRFNVNVGGKTLGTVTLQVPGKHNILNAAAAIAVGLELGVDFDRLADGVSAFEGIYRRFEIYGEERGVMVVDDFAHLPAEIRATINAARTGWERRVIAVFQPHLYSRTREYARQFGEALSLADEVFLLPIYGAREEPLEDVDSGLIVSATALAGQNKVRLCQSREEAVKNIIQIARAGDMVLVLGAGDVYKTAPLLLEGLKG